MKRSQFLLACGATLGAGSAFLSFMRSPAIATSTTYEVMHTDAEWLRILGRDRYEILRRAGTEQPFSSPLNNEKRAGIYQCYGCNLALFSSKTKYDPGEGWPSFWNVLPDATRTSDDNSLGMNRTEIHCRRCGGHLGHIFNDGPPPTGLRYCIDGLALGFIPGASA